jgi:hypothetical protein
MAVVGMLFGQKAKVEVGEGYGWNPTRRPKVPSAL